MPFLFNILSNINMENFHQHHYSSLSWSFRNYSCWFIINVENSFWCL